MSRYTSRAASISTALFAIFALAGCGGKLEGDGSDGAGNGLSGEKIDAATDTATATATAIDTASPPVIEDARAPTCDPDADDSARLSAVMTGPCAAPLPTRAVVGDEAAIAEFRTFVVGRWLACPSATGPSLPGPPGNVGIELTADGRAYFLKIDCTGAIVRGSGGGPSDAGITAWEDWYEILDGGQFNLYYGAPPGGGWASMNIAQAKFDGAPRRMWFENMGVYESMYVPAPDRL